MSAMQRSSVAARAGKSAGAAYMGSALRPCVAPLRSNAPLSSTVPCAGTRQPRRLVTSHAFGDKSRDNKSGDNKPGDKSRDNKSGDNKPGDNKSGDNPLRQAITGAVQNIFKAGATVQASVQAPEPGLSPLWAAVKRLNTSDVQAAIRDGADPNERNAEGDTPLLYIARQGHYKYPPAEVPLALIKGGADVNAMDKKGMTALQVSLVAGWQNIAELLIKNKAYTNGVALVKDRVTCPDCKRIIKQYGL